MPQNEREAMDGYFTYIDRRLPLQFFRENPIEAELLIGDHTEQQLLDMAKALDQAQDAEEAARALYPLLGEETAQAIADRAETKDAYGIWQVGFYLLEAYSRGKEKNLRAAGKGATASGICPTA